jgi:hypothetical protein
MPDSIQPIDTIATFDDILDELERLSREHLLFFRIEVGRVLLNRLFAGSAAAYLDRDPTKEARFAEFVRKCDEDLARFGLGENVARTCIQCCIVFDSLPAAVRNTLFLSQILELTRVTDPTARARLAVAAVEGDWTVRQLRDAVGALKAGLPYDADPDAPGVQPPTEGLPVTKAQPGRLVTQAEKWTRSVDDWTAQWAQVDKAKLRGVQRERVKAAVAGMRARLDRLAKELGV